MKTLFRKAAAIVFAFGLIIAGTNTVSIGATGVKAEQTTDGEFLKNVIGEYVPLFEGATFETKYDHYWHDFTSAVIGESMADYGVSMMKKAIGAATYGDQATSDFFCGYANDVTKVAFGGADGTEVTFTRKDGSTVKHTYEFVKKADASGATEAGQQMNMNGYLYKSKDNNTDDFAYLFMCPDTPATTYHLEFRWGDTEENILKLTDGKYKNWLAAGLSAGALTDPNETLLQQVIALFVIENVSSMSGDEANSQRLPITGKWDIDTTPFKSIPGYENANMYMELSKTGEGNSYIDMTNSGKYKPESTWNYFVYDTNASDGKDAGIYLVQSDEGVKTSTFEVSETEGKTALIFNSSEGVITYYYNSPLTPAKVTLSKVAASGSKKLKATWKEITGADGYKVMVSTNKNFKKSKTVSVKDKTTATVKKLSKKEYFVKVCAYVLDRTGKKVYGKYSAVKSVKIK